MLNYDTTFPSGVSDEFLEEKDDDFESYPTQQYASTIILNAMDKLREVLTTQGEALFLNKVRDVLPSYRDNPEKLLLMDKVHFLREIYLTLLDGCKEIKEREWKNNKLIIEIITPWLVELAKEKTGLTKFLGPVKDRILIAVVDINTKQQYIHSMTEDLLSGIDVLTYAFNKKFEYYIIDVVNRLGTEYPVSLTSDGRNVNNYYMIKSGGNRRFTAKIANRVDRDGTITNYIKVGFKTDDFIRGAVTGSMWLNKDPHKYIIEIEDYGEPVDF